MSGVYKPPQDGTERRGFDTSYGIDKEDRPVIRGNPIVFNSWSQVMAEWGGLVRFRERIRPDAVDRTLKGGSKVLAYWNHDSGKVLGSTRNGTLRLAKTTHALSMDLYPTSEWLASPDGATLKRGDVDQMSFGFRVMDDQWSDEPDDDGVYTRDIIDMVFSEVSIVGQPAYTETSVSFSARHEQRVYVEPKCLERFASGMSIDFARKFHQTRLAR